MTTSRPHAELAARQSVTDELRLVARSLHAQAGLSGWGNLCSDAADTIDNLRAQLAEAQGDAERWRRAAQCTRLDQFGGFVVTPDEPALDSDISLAFTREIDASIDAARGEKNGA